MSGLLKCFHDSPLLPAPRPGITVIPDGISSQRQPRRFPLWWFAAFPLVRKLVEYCEIFDLVLRIWQIVGYNRMVYWNLAECHSFCPDILLH